ncbi:MAG: NACHT domain-containing protein [Piscinibacter sp.]|nr:NACHT domain-containing protein [Piscinibacter sp.]
MALLEKLTIDLGGALVKSVLKLGIGGTLLEGPAGAAVDLAKDQLKDFQTRRQLERVASRIQDEVAEHLAAMIASEFASMPEAERELAAIAVSRVFLDIELPAGLVRADLDVIKFEALARSRIGNKFDDLAEDTYALASLMVQESASVAVSLAKAFPDLSIATTKESLSRLSKLGEDVSKILQLIDASRVRQQGGVSPENATFETHYRRWIATSLDRIQLFGLRMFGARSGEYGLTVAYVTLTSTVAGSRVQGDVSECLARVRHALLRGEAGSGKTTLFCWLAVHAATRSLSERLEHWNARMPFYIRLRDYREKELPTPERFIESAAPNLLGMQPAGWAHEKLLAGALILVDGVDELPLEKRRQFLTWILGVRSSFPTSVILISSRPATLDAQLDVPVMTDADPKVLKGGRSGAGEVPDLTKLSTIGARLGEKGFTSLSLEPMSPADSERFISLWHAAIGRELPADASRERLLSCENELIVLIQDRPALRAFSANPLLCAMVCALNWDRKRRLPDDRMELYRIALELLLEGRDADRNVPEVVALDRREKEEILDHLALWMLSNSYSEIPVDEAIEKVERFLPKMGGIRADARSVVQALLERSGVIRQPQFGIVDFIHKTFQEYMGARAAIAGGETGLLINNAHLPEWRETLVFAAGHARGKQRTKLVEGIIRPRWLQFGARPKELLVTAACCLETASATLEPKLLDALKADAKALFPPRRIEDARVLAPAAALEPAWLHPAASDDANVRAACIRTAAYVASRPMLEVIARNAALVDEIVEREVLRAWPAFDFTAFLEKVVLTTPTLFDGLVCQVSPSNRPLVQLLVGRFGSRRDVNALAGSLRSFLEAGILNISAAGTLSEADTDMSGSTLLLPGGDAGWAPGVSGSVLSKGMATLIAGIAGLRFLAVDRVEPGVLSQLTRLQHLSFLRVHLNSTDDLVDICGISSLRSLQVSGPLSDFNLLAGHRHLRRLDLRFTDVVSGKRLPRMSLELLALPAVRDLDEVFEACLTHELVLHLAKRSVNQTRSLRKADSLRSLRLACDPGDGLVLDIDPPPGLVELHIRGAHTVSFRRAGDLPKLRTLTLEGVHRLESADPVLGGSALETVRIDPRCGVDVRATVERCVPASKVGG